MNKGWASRIRTSHILIFSTCAFIFAAIAITYTSVWLKKDIEPELLRSLTKPLRLEVVEKNGFNEFLLGLRTFHYRVNLRSEANYVDVFFDTEDWVLARHGFSYRFRQNSDEKSTHKFKIRLEQEPRFIPAGSVKIDVTSDVPPSIGKLIAGGSWEHALLDKIELPVIDRLYAVLSELQIKPEHLMPRLEAQLHRARFDLTDKGQNWFEIDHELWTFRTFPVVVESASLKFEDIAIDTRLKLKDPELTRRVKTMRQFSTMIHGVRLANKPPHERAIEALRDG